MNFYFEISRDDYLYQFIELQWLKDLWNHEKMFEIVVVRANEC